MTVIVCTDKNGGMLFAGRRTSRDREMLADLGRLAAGRRLLCTPYSERLLTAAGLSPTVREDCLEVASEDDLVFIENLPLSPYRERITRLVVYSWDKAYPYDVVLDIPKEAEGRRLVASHTFPGFSHDAITKEVFEK